MKLEFNYRDYDDYKEWLDRVINTLYEDNNYLKNELIKEKGKNIKLKEYIEQLDKLEDKIDDYAISKYVKKDLLDILESQV